MTASHNIRAFIGTYRWAIAMCLITFAICWWWRLGCGDMNDDLRFTYYFADNQGQGRNPWFCHDNTCGERIDTWQRAYDLCHVTAKEDNARLSNFIIVYGFWLLPNWLVSMLGAMVCALLPLMILYLGGGRRILAMRWPVLLCFFAFWIYNPLYKYMVVTAFFNGYTVAGFWVIMLLCLLRYLHYHRSVACVAVGCVVALINGWMHEMTAACSIATLAVWAVADKRQRRLAIVLALLTMATFIAAWLMSAGTIDRIDKNEQIAIDLVLCLHMLYWTLPGVLFFVLLGTMWRRHSQALQQQAWLLAPLAALIVVNWCACLATHTVGRTNVINLYASGAALAVLFMVKIRATQPLRGGMWARAAALAAAAIYVFGLATNTYANNYYHQWRVATLDPQHPFDIKFILTGPDEPNPDFYIFKLAYNARFGWDGVEVKLAADTLRHTAPSTWPRYVKGDNPFVGSNLVWVTSQGDAPEKIMVDATFGPNPKVRFWESLLYAFDNPPTQARFVAFKKFSGVVNGDTLNFYAPEMPQSQLSQKDFILKVQYRPMLSADVTPLP